MIRDSIIENLCVCLKYNKIEDNETKDKYIVYANTVCAKTCYLVLNYHIILLQHQKHSGSVNLFSVIDCRAIDAGWAVFENTSN